ncbi:hypothetical protein [Janthinobacterium fluminis]|uniref:Bacteriocin-type signal sequence-containing protein n=1 Tax=Janthinobacterium fluminis TaxID=2987524 RepID=A0ABT5JVM5_9BURK|nr:hypothetical protein [Janthinobacterium fluminis]MDC8756782.1 hypothetical protein [Janthinobacterium fluminis]
MHPFSLNVEQIEQVSGGYKATQIDDNTTLAIGEEGGGPTTLALGEEGGHPPTLKFGEIGGLPHPDLV